jgi:hypothetical protein
VNKNYCCFNFCRGIDIQTLYVLQIATKKGFEMTQAEYKVQVKQTIKQKRKTIAFDRTEFDEKSNDYTTLENLERNTEV